MQIGCFASPRYDSENIINKINRLIERFRLHKDPIIFIQHNGIKENYMTPDTDAYKLHKSINATLDDIYIEKKANNAFYQTSLEKTLDKLGIDKLYFTGLATDFCVNATVMDALNHNYNIVIVNDAHTTADRPSLSAKQIIDFYNWLWINLTPTDSSIESKCVREILG
jgi:nicotinamidase-related amidase